jgi:hypothetical protein
MPYTNIDATVTDAQRTAALAAIPQIETNLPFLVNLTPKERQTLPKMGGATQSFVSKALEIADNNPQFIPPFVDLAAMRRDYELATRLQGIEMQLASVLEKVADTNTAAGSEAYVTGLSIYNSIKAAARGNIPGCQSVRHRTRRALRASGHGGGNARHVSMMGIPHHAPTDVQQVRFRAIVSGPHSPPRPGACPRGLAAGIAENALTIQDQPPPNGPQPSGKNSAKRKYEGSCAPRVSSRSTAKPSAMICLPFMSLFLNDLHPSILQAPPTPKVGFPTTQPLQPGSEPGARSSELLRYSSEPRNSNSEPPGRGSEPRRRWSEQPAAALELAKESP